MAEAGYISVLNIRVLLCKHFRADLVPSEKEIKGHLYVYDNTACINVVDVLNWTHKKRGIPSDGSQSGKWKEGSLNLTMDPKNGRKNNIIMYLHKTNLNC